MSQDQNPLSGQVVIKKDLTKTKKEVIRSTIDKEDNYE
jgi:hypothetical protein